MYSRCWRLVVALALCLTLVAPAQAARRKPLEKRVEKILGDPELGRGFWGIEVMSLTTGNILYKQNAEKLFTPASNTKLVTTAAALALIGPDYTFKTSVETTGILDTHGRLNGDLLLI